MVYLEEVADTPPEGTASMLQELGAGESGFGGTAFGTGELGMSEFLRITMKQANSEALPEGWVPQTTFWMIVDGSAVGLLRLRHHLNESLLVKGGHIGYYVRPAARREGVASEALRLALAEAAKRGIFSVMLTTNPENRGSIKVIEQNGGKLRKQIADTEDEGTISQYWIELAK